MTDSEVILQLEAHKEGAFKLRERRHAQWTESYEMYRDQVVVNRLIQRQSVNIPLMKMTVRTLLSKLKKKLGLVFEDYGNDKQKDVFKNAYWQECVKTARLKAKDTVNQKQVMLYGRTFWKLRIENGHFNAEVLDPQDVLIDRYVDPADIDGTAQDIIHLHIYKPLRELEADPEYDKTAIATLKAFYASKSGLIRAGENQQSAIDKAKRLSDMGVPDVLDPQVGETLVELNEHYCQLWDDGEKRFRYHIITTCDDQILRRKLLQEHLDPQNLTQGYWDKHTPIITWADDLERTDLWSDGVADIIRTINKVLNVWFSQLVENRTMRNFGMVFYDATKNENWSPQAFDPRPFGWYPLPGKPDDVFKKVDIPDLSESLDEMQFLINIAEQSTAATATQKGTSEKTEMTLGEIKLMLVEAEDRINDMQEPYEESWLEFGEKWSKLITGMAHALKPVSLYKKGYRGNYFPAVVNPVDFVSTEGYNCQIKSAADQEKDQITGIQKLLAVKAQFPNNLPFKKIVDKQLLELAGLNPEEVKEVEMYEAQVAVPHAMMAAATDQNSVSTQPNQTRTPARSSRQDTLPVAA